MLAAGSVPGGVGAALPGSPASKPSQSPALALTHNLFSGSFQTKPLLLIPVCPFDAIFLPPLVLFPMPCGYPSWSSVCARTWGSSRCLRSLPSLQGAASLLSRVQHGLAFGCEAAKKRVWFPSWCLNHLALVDEQHNAKACTPTPCLAPGSCTTQCRARTTCKFARGGSACSRETEGLLQGPWTSRWWDSSTPKNVSHHPSLLLGAAGRGGRGSGGAEHMTWSQVTPRAGTKQTSSPEPPGSYSRSEIRALQARFRPPTGTAGSSSSSSSEVQPPRTSQSLNGPALHPHCFSTPQSRTICT